MVRLGQESNPEAIELITMSEDYFPYDVSGCCLTPEAREELRNRVRVWRLANPNYRRKTTSAPESVQQDVLKPQETAI